MYELHIEGYIIRNEKLSELEKIADHNRACVCEIFEIKQSKMNKPGFMPHHNLTDKTIERIVEQHNRGYSNLTLAQRYGVSETTISKVIHEAE